MAAQRISNQHRFDRRCRSRLAVTGLALLASLALVMSACGGSEDDADAVVTNESNRSSGSSDSDTDTDTETDADTDAGTDTEAEAQTDADDTDQTGTTVSGPETVEPPTIRPDGLELAFVDGALGAARLGTTIDEIAAALGPAYVIAPEQSIRVDFPAGYSVSRGGEVLFFAIEEDGVITVFMTQHPRIGLDSGLRPGTQLDEAIAMHGEPTLTFGPEGREFASFADGTGGDGAVSVLVAIGQFGGPVGEDANIKELWFWAS